MNPYKWSFFIFLTTVVLQVVGDSGEYEKNNAYMLFNILLKIYMVAEEFSLLISKSKEKHRQLDTVFKVTKRRNNLQPPTTIYNHLEKFDNHLQPPQKHLQPKTIQYHL